jgi:hypothetical protein
MKAAREPGGSCGRGRWRGDAPAHSWVRACTSCSSAALNGRSHARARAQEHAHRHAHAHARTTKHARTRARTDIVTRGVDSFHCAQDTCTHMQTKAHARTHSRTHARTRTVSVAMSLNQHRIRRGIRKHSLRTLLLRITPSCMKSRARLLGTCMLDYAPAQANSGPCVTAAEPKHIILPPFSSAELRI